MSRWLPTIPSRSAAEPSRRRPGPDRTTHGPTARPPHRRSRRPRGPCGWPERPLTQSRPNRKAALIVVCHAPRRAIGRIARCRISGRDIRGTRGTGALPADPCTNRPPRVKLLEQILARLVDQGIVEELIPSDVLARSAAGPRPCIDCCRSVSGKQLANGAKPLQGGRDDLAARLVFVLLPEHAGQRPGSRMIAQQPQLWRPSRPRPRRIRAAS